MPTPARLLLVATIVCVSAAATDAQQAGKVALGPVHSVAIRTDGSVITWGENERGQLGRGMVDPPNVRREVDVVPGVTGAAAVTVGEEFTVLLLADGGVMTWGANQEGQLGHGPAGILPRPGTARPPVPVPARVTGLERITAIAAGNRFALALRDDGVVLAWGDGALGALGDGKGGPTGQHYAVPFARPIAGLPPVAAIAAGAEFGLALGRDGSVWGWGANEYGQLGEDVVGFKPTPVRIAGVTNVRSLHAGRQTGFALLADGTVSVWGRNACDLFGVPEQRIAKSATPRLVPGLSGVTQVAVSLTTCHALARLGDGTARGWGHNAFTQLGNGPATGGLVTIPLKDVASVAAGGYRSHVVLGDGRVFSLGFRMADLVDRVPREVASLDPRGVTRCTPGSAPAGGWSGGADQVNGAPPRAARAAALAKADTFRQMLTSVFAGAARIEGRTTRFIDVRAGGSMAFGVRADYLGSFCDESSGSLREEGGSRSEAALAANDLGPILNPLGEPVATAGGPVQLYHLAPRAGEAGGLPAFAIERGRAVLVTPRGVAPFVPVTRGEYLELVERHGQAGAADAAGGIDDTIKAFEAEIAQARKELSGAARDAVVAEMEKALAEMKAQAPQLRSAMGGDASGDLQAVRTYREAASAADLARPARVEAFGFTGAFDDGAREVVRLAPPAAGRPAEAVRWLLVTWTWNAGHPQDEAWRARFESRFPFDRLVKLVDE